MWQKAGDMAHGAKKEVVGRDESVMAVISDVGCQLAQLGKTGK